MQHSKKRAQVQWVDSHPYLECSIGRIPQEQSDNFNLILLLDDGVDKTKRYICKLYILLWNAYQADIY